MTPSIDVWHLSLAAARERFDDSMMLLSEDERQRAERFVYPEDAARFALCRATLRAILGEATGSPPRELTFEYGPSGKPRVADAIAFNIAHTRELMVCAVSRDVADLGIDLERIDTTTDVDVVVKHSFSPAERDYLSRLEGADRRRAFFQCWTRKEAYLKARGEGLNAPLTEVNTLSNPSGWTLKDLLIDDTHACCIAFHSARAAEFTISRWCGSPRPQTRTASTESSH